LSRLSQPRLMSGIAGVVQFDRSSLDPGLLQRLADFLAFRGPDAQRTWLKDYVGFAHTLLKTTEESERELQPITLDGKSWIVADARIDARSELYAAWIAAGQSDPAQSSWTDPQLILRAYNVWGEACVDRLRGDFAFAIWDDAKQELFCARDQMGVKLLYYAQTGSSVIFSNTLDCIRRHPLVSDRLNDQAVADFLLFGVNWDFATTSFAQIKRIPPAHSATWSASGFRLSRYWTIPVDEPLLYPRAGDYIDRFQDLLQKSVADRLRTNRVWVFMSGGLDSPTLAATARNLLRRRYQSFELQALTTSLPDVPDEDRYAQAVANYLKIPIRFRESAETAGADWEKTPFSTPEPCVTGWSIPAERKFWRELGTCSRVFFFGEGPDNALEFEWRPCVSYLLSRHLYLCLLTSSAATVFSQRYPPFWFRLANRFRKGETPPVFPPWINPTLESRLQLQERWRQLDSVPVSNHPWRPTAYASFGIPLWQTLFEFLDAATTRACFEVRHPFLDLGMLRFLLAVPALPWCRSKYLLRRAMRGALPLEVLRRRKTGRPNAATAKHLSELCSAPFQPAPGVREYLHLGRLPGAVPPALAESGIRARILNHWLQNSLPPNHNQEQEPHSGRVV
jgi:asparagine synthase (glutamine-hydrolysing)